MRQRKGAIEMQIKNLDGKVLKDLEGADLVGAYLRGAYLRGAYLRGAYLVGANFRGADLRGAYLRGAYLRGADLRGADLLGTDLEGADLTGANLAGADLEGAYLEENIIKKLVGRLWRMEDPYEFFGFDTSTGLMVKAGCRLLSLPNYIIHTLSYPSETKRAETIAILQFLEARAKQS